MKKIFVILLAVLGLMIFGGCNKEVEPVDETPVQTITTLEGKWVGYDEWENEDRWSSRYEATIADGVIKIVREKYGFNLAAESKFNVCWYGTYINPATAVSEYSWDSDADESKIEYHIHSRPPIYGDKVTFTFKDGKISFVSNPQLEYDKYDNPLIVLEKVD